MDPHEEYPPSFAARGTCLEHGYKIKFTPIHHNSGNIQNITRVVYLEKIYSYKSSADIQYSNGCRPAANLLFTYTLYNKI